MIEVINLVKYYGQTLALDNVSFSVKPGEICGYIGPNGAGKTTTIKILIGIIKPTSGLAYVNQINVAENPDAVKKLIGYVPETGSVFETLTPMEYLNFIGKIYGLDEKTIKLRSSELMEIFDIKEHANEPMANFSKGMKQKVLIISAIIHDPKIILLDEPLNGLDVDSIQAFKFLIQQMAERGKTVLYSSHLLDIVEKLCDKIVLINAGRIAAGGTVEEILNLTQSNNLNDAISKLLNRESSFEKIQNFVSKLR